MNADIRREQARLLRDLHAVPGFSPRAWRDSADAAFISITLLERSIARLAPELTGRFLDVGCGLRPYAAYFSHLPDQKGCDLNAARGPVDIVCPAHQVPLPDASLDSILCTEVLEHTPDPAAVWQEFARLLRPGGKVLLTTPMYWPSHEEPYDFYRYPEYGLRHLASNAGFEVLELMPRGGVWAFLGQVLQHSLPQYLRFRWQRTFLNRLFLKFDAWRCNPALTVGWTILAVKKPAAKT